MASDGLSAHAEALDGACAPWQFGAVGRGHEMNITLAFEYLPRRYMLERVMAAGLTAAFENVPLGAIGNHSPCSFHLRAQPSHSFQGGVVFEIQAPPVDPGAPPGADPGADPGAPPGADRGELWHAWESLHLADVAEDTRFTKALSGGGGARTLKRRCELRFDTIEGGGSFYPGMQIGTGGLVRLRAGEGCPRLAMLLLRHLGRYHFEGCRVVGETGYPEANSFLEWLLMREGSAHIWWPSKDEEGAIRTAMDAVDTTACVDECP